MTKKHLYLAYAFVIALATGCSCDCDDPKPEVIANFTFEKDADDYRKVTFTNTSENYESLSWNFGDGTDASAEENPVHIFEEEGTYNVRLTATGKDGKIAEKNETIVIVDQTETLTLQPNDVGGKDANIAACIPCGYNDNNYGSLADFKITSWTNNGDDSNSRGLIEFDISSIPAGATIVSAKLSLYYKQSNDGAHSTLTGSNAAYIQKVTSSWSESTVTWDTQPSSTDAGQVTIPASTSDTQDYPNIDITSIVQGWANDQTTNFGLLIRMQDESPYRRLAFASSDYTEASKRPKLVIEYVKP
jgi:PKD repeat protein